MATLSSATSTKTKDLLSARGFAVFIIWTVTSFLCHAFAKSFLSRLAESPSASAKFTILSKEHDAGDFSAERMLQGAMNATILTAVQMGICFIFVRVDIFDNDWTLNVAKVCHVVATWFTNLSMACMFASSTFAIKLMEPITSAVVQYFILATPLSPVAILSLPVIVGGAILFSGNPLTQTNLPFGIAAAFMSNIVLAFRNVALKSRMTTDEKSGVALRPFRSSLMGVAAICMIGLGLARIQGLITDRALFITLTCVISGLAHVVYSYVSTGIVLQHMSVVSHAVTNILKRVLVVLLLYVTGSRSASPTNFLGLGVCTLGLVAYAWSKRDNTARTASSQDYHPPKQRIDLCTLSKYIVLVTGSLFCGVCLGVVRDFTIPTTADSVFPSVVLDSAGYKQQFAQWTTEKINDTQFERTFTHRAQELPNKEDLLPDLGGYLSQYKNDIEDFLEEDLVANPNRSSFLSSKLRTHVEVIKEAQRLHFDIIGTVLKKYKYGILFDLAAFENKGDPCISVGETHFLARIKLKLLYFCAAATCTKERFRMAEKIARRYSTDDLAILVHGGGNIVGYKTLDEHRFTIFEMFKGFKIFVFPQSVFINNFKSSHFEICKKKYCCNENVTFVMRDHQSYRYAQQYFSGTTKYILTPDMAFQIGPMSRSLSPVFDIMWIRRTDTETPGYKAIPSAPPGIRMHVSDWWQWTTPGAPNSMERAHYICTNGFFYLQRGRVVITDRLHGHILATLMNIPHVLIDNKEHKLSAYHLSWTAGLENTYITDNPDTALDLALKLLEKYKDVLPPRLPFLQIDERTSKIVEFGKPEDGYA